MNYHEKIPPLKLKCPECGTVMTEGQTLEDKMRDVILLSTTTGTPQKDGHYHTTHNLDYAKLAQIAEEHFKEEK